MKFDHLGVVVAEIGEAREFLGSSLGIQQWTEIFEDPGIGVYVQFGIGDDGPCFELIAPLHPESPICGALKTGRGILNHVAYLVTDLQAATSMLRDQGCLPVDYPKPAVAYHGRLVQFFQTPLRFIIEIIEAPSHEHLFRSNDVSSTLSERSSLHSRKANS